jgi:hypothetical protein
MDGTPLPDRTDQSVGRLGMSYQESFRAIGSILDNETTGSIGIVEVDDGFLLRVQRTTVSGIETSLTHLQHSVLTQYSQELRRVRPGSHLQYHPGFWSTFTVSLQDVFRALGHELDAVGARHVVVDEMSDGLLLAYEQRESEGAPARQWRFTLGRIEIEDMVQEAGRRRRVPADAAPTAFSRVKRDRPGEERPPGLHAVWHDAHEFASHHDRLRSIGRVLDERGARNLCLLEAPGEVVIRYQQPPDDHLTWTRFEDAGMPADGPANRQPTRHRFKRITPPDPGPYADLLRVIGEELPRMGAFDILLFEQDDGITITYQFRDPEHLMKPRRTSRSFDLDEQRRLVQQAHARRQPETGLRARIAGHSRDPQLPPVTTK